tara:strand:- start:6753 stop:7175 length:423 start_codon:yes stop_codon:yes gene_type:complete
MKTQKHTLRFNLGKGENYMKWKHTKPNGKVEYLDPEHVSFVCGQAKLRNHRGTAEKIFSGDNKSVCAWIECDTLMICKIVPSETVEMFIESGSTELSYNPRVAPHWRDNMGNDVDNCEYSGLITHGKRVYSADQAYIQSK